MNHRFFHFLILFVIPVVGFSQTKTKKDYFKGEGVLAYTKCYLFRETASYPLNTGEKITGHAYGCDFTIGVPYPDFEINLNKNKKFMLGWMASSQLGYGQFKGGGHWFPFTLDMGFIAGYAFNKHVEIGSQYAFLGIYGWSKLALFGSNFTLKARVWRFQTEFASTGMGAIRGFVSPRFEGRTIKTFRQSYSINENVYVGLYECFYDTSQRTSKTHNPVNEFRFCLGMNFSSWDD